MTQEALKKMYQLLLTEPHATTVCAQLERIAREALAEHAMRETQRLGQEIEPVTDDIASIIACRDMLDAQPVPPRKWVELTEQQRNDIEEACEMIIGKPAFDLIDAALKGNNT
jgi:hypothetical protein